MRHYQATRARRTDRRSLTGTPVPSATLAAVRAAVEAGRAHLQLLSPEQISQLAVAAARADTPTGWLRAGQALPAAWLAAAEHGVAVLPFSAPVEMSATRVVLRRLLAGLGHPHLVLRLGSRTRTTPARRIPPDSAGPDRRSSTGSTRQRTGHRRGPGGSQAHVAVRASRRSSVRGYPAGDRIAIISGVPDRPSLGLGPLPRVRLDELLTELLDRVGDVLDSRERLRALLDAVVGIARDLDLHSTLGRIAEAACVLVGARYGALGVIGPDGRLVDFITHGVIPEQHAAIGDLPTGRGVLGLLIEDPRPVRMPDITQHPQSYGFPPRHPPMHSFLGVPIHIRDQVFGNLYLAEKQGADEFTEDDEAIVVALAAAAGVSIENARLYEVAGRRERWLAATAEITTMLLGAVERTGALQLVADRARQVAGTELAVVLLFDPEADTLTVEVAAGAGAEGLANLVLPATETLFAPVVTERRHLVVDSLGKAAAWPVPVPAGPAVLAPLAVGDTVHGILAVAHRAGQQPHTDDDLPMLTTFAGQAALALERAQAQDERETIIVLEDRERIARDLHDVVIQRLFATGLQLQTAARLAVKPEVAQRVTNSVDDLDATIRDIRSAIFELRGPTDAVLRAELRATITAAAEPLGFRPVVDLAGPLDSAVPDRIQADLLAVVQEALSNVVRHARATAVWVAVTATNHHLTVSVQDNGVGIPSDAAERGGLANLRRRAEQHSGSFTIRDGDPSGTTVVWSVPI